MRQFPQRSPPPRPGTWVLGDDALAQCLACAGTDRGRIEGSAQRQIVLQLSNALQGIIAQELLPAADRTRRVLAYELIVANGAVRNLIRENQVHQLENTIQTGRKEGMTLMDNCLYDLYLQVPHHYDTAVSRARHR